MSERDIKDEQLTPEFSSEEQFAIEVLRERLNAASDPEERKLVLESILCSLGHTDKLSRWRTVTNHSEHTEAQEREITALHHLHILFPDLELEDHQTMHRLSMQEDDETTEQFIGSLHTLMTGPADALRERVRLEESMVRLRLIIEGFSYTQINKLRGVSHTAVIQNIKRLGRDLNGIYRKQVCGLLNSVYGFSIDTTTMPESLEPHPKPYGRGKAPVRKLGRTPVAAMVETSRLSSRPAIATSMSPPMHPTASDETIATPPKPEKIIISKWDEHVRQATDNFAALMKLDDDEATALSAFLSPVPTDTVADEQQQTIALRLRDLMSLSGFEPETYRWSISELYVARTLLGLPLPSAKEQVLACPQSVAKMVREYRGDLTDPRNRTQSGYIETNVYSMLNKVQAKLHQA